jgi:hypothetical protein
MKTKVQEYEICRCTGEVVGRVKLRIPIDAQASMYDGKAIAKAGFVNYVCDGCYNDAYYTRLI